MLLDRFPPRRIILPSILVFALALASLSRLGPSIKRFYLTYFILASLPTGLRSSPTPAPSLPGSRSRRGLRLP